jgi:hypothetical protein
MNKLNLLKKIFLGAVIISSLTNCSSDAVDEWNDTISGVNKDSRITMKIDNRDYQEDFRYNSLTNVDEHTITWKKSKNLDGSFNYSIHGDIETTDPMDIVVGYSRINISLGNNNVVVGKVYNVTTVNFDFNIIFGSGLSNKEYLIKSGITTGQLKITHFDGITMSGEFNFNSLAKEVDGAANTYTSTASGVFTKIEELK